jgi:transposase
MKPKINLERREIIQILILRDQGLGIGKIAKKMQRGTQVVKQVLEEFD